jgi:hypothetical protein
VFWTELFKVAFYEVKPLPPTSNQTAIGYMDITVSPTTKATFPQYEKLLLLKASILPATLCLHECET